jgi:hypothetical protein
MPTLITQIETEWEHIVASRREAFGILQRAEPALAPFAGLDAIVAALQPHSRPGKPDFERRDQILLALLHQAENRTPAGDLAMSTVLYVMLPGVKRRIVTQALRRFEAEDRAPMMLAALLSEIREPRSPWGDTKVAAQLLGRATDRLRRSRGLAGKVKIAPSGHCDPTLLARLAPGTASANAELLLLLAEVSQLNLMTKEKLRLIALIRVQGVSRLNLAGELRISRKALDRRLERAEHELCKIIAQNMLS